jgi:hypothetical protein
VNGRRWRSSIINADMEVVLSLGACDVAQSMVPQCQFESEEAVEDADELELVERDVDLELLEELKVHRHLRQYTHSPPNHSNNTSVNANSLQNGLEEQRYAVSIMHMRACQHCGVINPSPIRGRVQ